MLSIDHLVEKAMSGKLPKGAPVQSETAARKMKELRQNGPKTLQEARERIVHLESLVAAMKPQSQSRTEANRESAAPLNAEPLLLASERARSQTPAIASPAPAPQPAPAPEPWGNGPRYPSAIRAEMIRERDSGKLYALYREHQEAEKFYGKYCAL
jgi:hypothetical protein